MAKKRGRPHGTGKPIGSRPGSRAWILDHLAIGESAFFVGAPGQLASRLMASIASIYKAGRSMSKEGLTQQAGISIFEGEVARPVVKVTRIAEAIEHTE